MDYRMAIVLWLVGLLCQNQICFAVTSSNCTSDLIPTSSDSGDGDSSDEVTPTDSGCSTTDEVTPDPETFERDRRRMMDNILPGVDDMRSMDRLPWIGGDIQKFAADLHDAKTRADAERQPTDEFHKVAESLMELLVRISENPEHWRVMTKNILRAHMANYGMLPPEDKKSDVDNRTDKKKPSGSERGRNAEGRRRRLGGGGNKKKKPRQKGDNDKEADANRTDLRGPTARPLTEQERRQQRLRQLAEAGVLLPAATSAEAPVQGQRPQQQQRPAAHGGRRRPEVGTTAPLGTTAMPPLVKQDWKNFQQHKMVWKQPRPTPAPAAHRQTKVLTPIYGRYPSTTMNGGSSAAGQKFGTLTRHAPDGPTVMTPLDKVRKLPDGPRGDVPRIGDEGSDWDNATLSALRHGPSLSRDVMLQRLLQNRPLPAELDLLSRQLGRGNKSQPDDEFGRWKQQMEWQRLGPHIALAPTPGPAPHRYRPYLREPLVGEAPSNSRLPPPLFDYHRQPPTGKGPFASVTVPSSTDQLRNAEFASGRLVRMRDPLEQQLEDMAASAERHRLMRQQQPVWGQPVAQVQAAPLGQERFMSLSDIEQQLRYHTQETNRLRKILSSAVPRRT